MVCDLLEKIELLQVAGTHFTPADSRAMVETFYEIITTVDNKGLAQLAFDDIVAIVAATTFAVAKGGVLKSHWLAILVIVLSLSGAVAHLLVARIFYPFYGYVWCSAPHKLDFTREIHHPANLIGRRTDYFHFA